MSKDFYPIEFQLVEWFMRTVPALGVRRVAPLNAAIASDTGLVRDENQDRAAFARGRDGQSRPYIIAALADGIGGMKEGASCASKSLAALISAVASASTRGGDVAQWLREGFEHANNRIHEEYKASGGSTLVAIVHSFGRETYWASVGDSRLYQYSDKTLRQVSKDDTLAGQLGSRPELGIEQSKLLQYIGIGSEIELHVEPLKSGTGDYALLTTDGVHFLERPSGVFGSVVHNASNDPATCIRRLVEIAKWCGGPDNATAIAIPCRLAAGDGASQKGWLDVWDPFGEFTIAIPVHAPARVEQPTPERSMIREAQPTTSPKAAEPVVPEHPHISSEGANQGDDVAPTIRKTKKKRAPKKSKVTKPSDLLDGKPPQVHIEFSGK